MCFHPAKPAFSLPDVADSAKSALEKNEKIRSFESFGFLCGLLAVVIPGLQKVNALLAHQIDEAVFLRQPPRPAIFFSDKIEERDAAWNELSSIRKSIFRSRRAKKYGETANGLDRHSQNTP